MQSRQALGIKIALIASIFCTTFVQAQSYPTSTVQLVTGYQAGSATDVLARAVQPLIQKALGQPVIVENRPGASGAIAIQRMLNAHDSAHTLFLGTASDFILTPLQVPSAKYTAESVKLVAATAYTQMVLIARPGLDVKDVDSLATHIKNPANPPLSYASTGSGSIFHLAMEQFVRSINANMVHVPFTGLGQISTNLIGNQVDVALVPLVGPIVALINDGKFKALAVTGPKRNRQVPGVPSVDETKAMQGFHFDMWVGLFAPANTPSTTLQRLNKVFNDAQSSEEFKRFAQANGVTPLDTPMSLEAAAKYYGEVTAQYRRIASGVKIDSK